MIKPSLSVINNQIKLFKLLNEWFRLYAAEINQNYLGNTEQIQFLTLLNFRANG